MAEIRSQAADSARTSQAIIDSALAVMAEEGIANLTTKSVSQRASVSTGAIHYFFETKEKLIYSAFVHVVRTLRDETTSIRRREPDPIRRLRSSLEVHFSPFHFQGAASNIWPQLWVHAGVDAAAARLFHVFSKRMISNCTVDLMEVGLDRKRARLKAIELIGLMRGLWLQQRLAKTISGEDSWRILDAAINAVALETGGIAARSQKNAKAP